MAKEEQLEKNINVYVHPNPLNSPKEDKKKRWKLGPPIISAVASTIAALFAAYVTLSTSTLENRINVKIANGQQQTARQIAELQETTKKEIAKSQESIERAREFGKLVEEISDPRKSSIALLALWKLYPDEADRKIVVVAALLVGKKEVIETFEILGADVKPYLKYAKMQGDQKIVEAANTILEKIEPKIEGQILINKIEKINKVSPSSDLVKSIIPIAKKNEDVRKLIAKRISTGVRNRETLLYILYSAGEHERLDDILNPVKKDLSKYGEIEDILRFGRFGRDDWLKILSISTDFLNSPNIPSKKKKAAFDILDVFQIDQTLVDTNITQKIVRVTFSCFTDFSNNTWSRYYAIEGLAFWSPGHAINAMSLVLAGGETDGRIISVVGQLLNGELQKEGFISRFPHIQFPTPQASRDVWKRWRELNAKFLSRYECKSSSEPDSSPYDIYVIHGYLGILGREAKIDERQKYIRFLKEGKTIRLFCRKLVDGSEFKRKTHNATPEELIERLYQGILNRNPDTQGFHTYVKEIEKEKERIAEIAALFIECNEFQSKFLSQ